MNNVIINDYYHSNKNRTARINSFIKSYDLHDLSGHKFLESETLRRKYYSNRGIEINYYCFSCDFDLCIVFNAEVLKPNQWINKKGTYLYFKHDNPITASDPVYFEANLVSQDFKSYLKRNICLNRCMTKVCV